MELFQLSDTILDERTEAEAMALIVNHLRETLRTVVGFTDDHVLVATHNACGGSKFVSSQQFWYIFILLEQGIIEDGLFATHYTDGRVETMTKAEMFADVDR